MKKFNFILAGLILGCATMARGAQSDALPAEAVQVDEVVENQINPAQDSATVIDTREVAKWQYVQNYFVAGINTINIKRKIGKFLHAYSSLISIPATVIITFYIEDKWFNPDISRVIL